MKYHILFEDQSPISWLSAIPYGQVKQLNCIVNAHWCSIRKEYKVAPRYPKGKVTETELEMQIKLLGDAQLLS